MKYESLKQAFFNGDTEYIGRTLGKNADRIAKQANETDDAERGTYLNGYAKAINDIMAALGLEYIEGDV
jgi:hypothetical protein